MLSRFSCLRISQSFFIAYQDFFTQTVALQKFPAYVKLHFKDIKAQNQQLSSPEIMKKLSLMYKSAPAAEIEKLEPLPPKKPTIKSEAEKSDDRKQILLARKHGLPRSPPMTAYRLFVADKLSGNKGKSLTEMTSKLSEVSKEWADLPDSQKEQYQRIATENKLSHLRDINKWAEEHQIQFSKRISVLVKRFYAKHNREQAKIPEVKMPN